MLTFFGSEPNADITVPLVPVTFDVNDGGGILVFTFWFAAEAG